MMIVMVSSTRWDAGAPVEKSHVFSEHERERPRDAEAAYAESQLRHQHVHVHRDRNDDELLRITFVLLTGRIH